MTKAETQAYFESISGDLTPEERAIVIKAFNNDKIHNAFVPRSEFSKSLNDKDAETKAAKENAEKWENWYKTEAKPAYDTYKKGEATLKKYIESYGPLEDVVDVNKAVKATGMTKEEVLALVNENLNNQGARYVDLTKQVAYVMDNYRSKFGETLDLDAVEKYALEHNMPLKSAYKEFIAPKEEELRNKEWEVKLKQAREEGARDAASRQGVKSTWTQRDDEHPHPLFDQEKVNPDDADKKSRAAFFAGLEEPVAK